jgi:hypothetical protein
MQNYSFIARDPLIFEARCGDLGLRRKESHTQLMVLAIPTHRFGLKRISEITVKTTNAINTIICVAAKGGSV